MFMKKFLQDFKEFAMRGNVVELAVAVVIGGAFGKIVTSLVTDIITPLAGMLAGGRKFDNLKIVLREATEDRAAIAIQYGSFVQATVDFLIITLAIFLTIKGINRLKRKEEEKKEASLEPSREVALLEEIRDAIRNK